MSAPQQHPSSLALEAIAVGESPPPEVGAHVERCDECARFVERARGLAGGEPRRDLDALLERLSPKDQVSPTTPPRRLWLVGATIAPPLAAAALLFLLLRSPHQEILPPVEPTPTTEPSPTPTSTDETTFKGGLQIAVIRERLGSQARFTGHVMIRPGDRLRVEVSLDREENVEAAIIADDASFLELMAPLRRRPGTYFGDKSARVDDTPMRGTIVVGAPEAIANARTRWRSGERPEGSLEGVATIRVEWESP